MDYMLSAPVATLPYQILAYYPFWNGYLRFSRRQTFFLLSLLFFLKCACFYFLVPQLVPARLLDFSFSVIHVFTFLYLVKLHPGTVLFFFFFLLAYLGFNRGIASFFQVCFTTMTDVGFYGRANGFLHLAVMAVTVPFLLRLFRKTCHEIVDMKEEYIASRFWIIPALTLVTSFVYSIKMTPETARSIPFLLSRIFLFLGTLVEYIILIRLLQAARRHALLEAQAKNNQLLSAMHREQYALLLKRIEETRRARHDLRQHLVLVQGYLEDGDKEALREYVRIFGQSIPEPANSFVYCGNYAVDTIMRFYLTQAKDEGINVEVSLPLPKQLPVPESDVCVLLGNLLENALAACRRLGEAFENRYIRVHGLFTPPYALSFTVDNSFCADQQDSRSGQREGGQSFDSADTTDYDRPGLGLGLSSVRATAERFGGTVKFERTETEFRASVLLFGKGEQKDNRDIIEKGGRYG